MLRDTIRAMQKANRKVWVFMFVAIAAITCVGQGMQPPEYTKFLKRLDTSAVRWREQFEALNVEKFNVSYSAGKNIEQAKQMALQQLTLIRQIVSRQLVKDYLSNDISLAGSLQDVLNMQSSITDFLPETGSAAFWGKPLSMEEFSDLSLPLSQHILSYAERLQEEAERCSP